MIKGMKRIKTKLTLIRFRGRFRRRFSHTVWLARHFFRRMVAWRHTKKNVLRRMSFALLRGQSNLDIRNRLSVHAVFYGCAFLFVFLEASLFYPLSFFSVKPNLILLLVTFYTFYFNYSAERVLSFCVVCGLLKDVMSGAAPGTHMILFLFLGIALRYLSKRFLRYNWIFLISLFVVATALHSIFYFFVQRFFFDAHMPSWWLLWLISTAELAYGLILFALFFKPIKRCVIDKLS